MKKILSTALMFIILSATTVDTINAARSSDSASMTARRGMKRRPAARGRRGRRGGARSMRNNSKQVQMILETVKTTDNPVVKAEAMKTANELAKELLMDLQDRTWAGDVLGKYTPEQVAEAGAKYTKLEIERNQLVRDIEFKQNEINGMSTKSMIFWTKAEGGKEEAHKRASEQLADMKATLVRTNKAMRNQAVIAGKEYCSAIRMAIGALTAVAVAGGVALVDKYKYDSAGMIAIKKGAGKQYEELTTKGVRTYVSEKAGALYGTAGEVVTSISDWATTQYNKLPDVAYIGTKARADRKAAAAAIKTVQNTEVKIETETKKLVTAPAGTIANEKIQDKIDELKEEQNQQIERAENLVDKVNENAGAGNDAGDNIEANVVTVE